jgi:type IV fimbrial biogenesis protein FimT
MAGMSRPAVTACLAFLDRLDRRLDRGVTLIEVLIVVAVLAILSATAVPSFAAFLAGQRVTAAANDFLHAIALARAEALQRAHRVYLAPIDGHWRNGWTLFVDRNDDRQFDPDIDEALLRHGPLSASTSIVNPANPAREPFTDVGSPERTYVLFDGTGYPRQRNGGFQAGSLAISDRAGATVIVRTICLSSYGRARIVAAASC